MSLTVPALIRPGLYLGSFADQENAYLLQEYGVSHILQVGIELYPSHADKFTYKQILIHDMAEMDLIKHIQICFSFIETARYSGGGVLVHCLAGVSRSASVVIAYLMWSESLSFEDALATVQAARPVIKPNPGFLLQLKEFEQMECNTSCWQGWDAKRLAAGLQASSGAQAQAQPQVESGPTVPTQTATAVAS